MPEGAKWIRPQVSCEWARKGRTYGLVEFKGNPGSGSSSRLRGLILGEEKKIATDPRLPHIVCKTTYNHNIQHMSRKKPLTCCLPVTRSGALFVCGV